MSERHARGGRRQMTADSVILLVSSFLAALLVIAGLIYAMGASERNKAALAAASCEPNLSPSGRQCTTAQMLASEFMAIMTPASRQLNTEMAAYTASEGDNLAAAEAALTLEVTSERALDRSLAGFTFPPTIAPIAKALVRANEARAKLTAKQARSSSLARLRSFDQRVQVACAAVHTEMKLIRKALDSPPPVA